MSENIQKPYNLITVYEVLICLMLALSISVIYMQVRHYDYIDLDDSVYVTENKVVQSGFTMEGVVWAFTTDHGAFWIPVTWLSHMLDCWIFDLNPGKHHLVNVLFHVLNTILLFLLLNQVTKRLWKSAFVAALFAIHPLHVESVAWVAERKDVLSTFFLVLTIGAYIRYVKGYNVRQYALSLVFYTFGLMSKPMIVTLPFLLLILDYWPLGRIEFFGKSRDISGTAEKNSGLGRLLLEKVPFLLFALIASVITFLFHLKDGSVASLGILPFGIRLANTSVSYVEYIVKMLFPFDLAVLYPYPKQILHWKVYGSGVLVIISSCFFVRQAKSRPYLLAGWLWYLGSLFPVNGLLHAGLHAMADRFMYVPMIGLSIIAAWGGGDLLRGWQYQKIGNVIISSIILFSFAVISFIQTGYWSDSITLFTHTLSITSDNYLINHNLNVALRKAGKYKKADKYYYDALRIRFGPGIKTQEIFGRALIEQGRYDDAIDYFTTVLKENPDNPDLLVNMGNAFAAKGMLNKAEEKYSRVLELQPGSAEVHNSLGLIYLRRGALENAVTCFKDALKLNPDFLNARHNLNKTLADLKEIQDAVIKMRNALDIDPEDKRLKTKLKILSDKKLNLQRVINQFEQSLSMQPGYHTNSGEPLNVKRIKTEYQNHLPAFERMIRLNPGNAEAYYHAACIYSLKKNKDRSSALLKMAIENGFRNLDLFLIDKDLLHIKKSQDYDAFIEKITKNIHTANVL